MGTFRVTFGEINTRTIGTNDYEQLVNKPKIEHVTLIGDRTFEDLGLLLISNSDIEDMFSR